MVLMYFINGLMYTVKSNSYFNKHWLVQIFKHSFLQSVYFQIPSKPINSWNRKFTLDCNKINDKYMHILNFKAFGGILLPCIIVNGLYCTIIVNESITQSNEFLMNNNNKTNA